MSLTTAHTLSLTSFRPDKSKSQSKEDVASALKQLDMVKGCKGWKFEGVAREDPSVSVRCIEWDSSESASAGASQYDKVMQSVTTETLYSRIYNIYDPLDKTLGPEPECLEYVVFSLREGMDFATFYPKWRQALKPVLASPGCCPVSLGQAAGEPQRVVHIQGWMTLEDHIEGFKKRGDLPSIMGPLTEVVTEYVEDGWKGFHAYHLLLTGPGEAM